MKLAELASRLPKPTGNPNADITAILAALANIFRLADSFEPLQAVGGDVLVGNRPLSQGASSGFLRWPTIDGSGPPTGTPSKQGAGDPIVYTRDDKKLWIYSFERGVWEEFPQTDDDNEILELLLMILRELEFHRDSEI